MTAGGITVVSCIVLAACGPATPAPATSVQPAHEVLPDVPFDDLDHAQRLDLMKQRVVTAMATSFRSHDSQRFARFECATCHGPGAARGDYDMPNPQLPRLALHELSAGTSRFKPEDIRWMTDDVAPAMADLLKLPRWSPTNHDGFGCASCHLIDE